MLSPKMKGSHIIEFIVCDFETIKTEHCVLLSPKTAQKYLRLYNIEKLTAIRKRLMPFDDSCQNDKSQFEFNQITNSFNNVKTSSYTLNDFFPVRKSVRKTKKAVLEERRKAIEKTILSGQENGLKVKIFDNKGRGIVTTKAFKRGDFVAEYAGDLVDIEEAKRREAFYSHFENVGCYMYYFKHKNKRYCVDATQETRRLGRLINHSKNGNLITRTMEINGNPHLILIANEDIKPGTELCYDYGDRSKMSLRYHPWLAF